MRCRKHHTDFTSSVGVCASCLRERLFSLIAAQAQAQQQTRLCSRADDPLPPPLVFPRSVSPYISRRKSDENWSDLSHGGHRRLNHHRFYSTPQIGPTYRNSSATSSFVTTGSFGKKQKSRFSLLSSLFRSRSDKFEKNHNKNPARESGEPVSNTSSPSWFSTIFSGRRNKQSNRVTLDEPIGAAERRQCHGVERGMSPARISDLDEEHDGVDRSPTSLGLFSPKLQQSPIAAHGSIKRIKPVHKGTVSGFAFCLSPLVRASPNRSWSQKGLPPEITFSGEQRSRSRKIADFGRVNHNR